MKTYTFLTIITIVMCFTINTLPSENKSKKRTFSQALTHTSDFQQPTKKPRLKDRLSTTIENFKQDSYQEQYTDLEKEFEHYVQNFETLKETDKIAALKRYISTDYSAMDFAYFIKKTALTDDALQELVSHAITQQENEEIDFYIATLLHKLNKKKHSDFYKIIDEQLTVKVKKILYAVEFMELFIKILENTFNNPVPEKMFESTYGSLLCKFINDGVDINDHMPALIIANEHYSQCPLICALCHNNKTIVKFLLQQGASYNVNDLINDDAALDIAEKTDNSLVEIMLQYVPHNDTPLLQMRIDTFHESTDTEQKATLLKMICNQYKLESIHYLIHSYTQKNILNQQEFYTELFTHALIVYKNNSHSYNLPLVLEHLVRITPPEYYQTIKETLLKKCPQLKECINNAL